MTKIGIIGAGRWATPYAVAAKALGYEVVGIYAPDASAAVLAEKVGAQTSSDPQHLVETADCILIGSPTDTHGKYLGMAAEIGKPALCASPVSAVESEAFATVATNLYASFPLRARPEYQRLKSAIASGDLGQLGMIRLGMCLPMPGGWRADTERSGGALMETGVHLIDALEWLGGPIARVYGAAARPGPVQYNLVTARMADGTIAHLEVSWAEADGVSYDYYEVAGSQGMLDYDSRREPLMVVDNRAGDGPEVLAPGATAAQNELAAFVAKLNGESVGLMSLQHGLGVCRTARRVAEAVDAGEVCTLS